MSLVIKCIIAIVATILVLSFLILTYMSKYLYVDNDLVESDAIVILMGHALSRVPEAADLYKGGYSDLLIMVQGVHPTETSEAQRDAIKLGIPEGDIIVLPGQARSTWEEAEIIRKFLSEKKDLNSLILVNSALQTRRTVTTFQNLLGCLDRDIKLVSRASRYIKVEDKYQYCEPVMVRWWQDLTSIRALVIESVKYFYYLGRSFFYGGCGHGE